MESKKNQLRFLFDIYTGSTLNSGISNYWNGDIPWVTPEDISNLKGYTILDTIQKITEEAFNTISAKQAPKNSIVITKRGTIGKVAIIGIDACCNQSCLFLVPKKEIIPEYYYYYLSANTPLLQSLGRGTTIKDLSLENIKSFYVPSPSLENQREAVLMIQNEINKIDKLLSLNEKQSSLLKEKRTSIITQNFK